jgi:hypothetical protein
MEKEMEKNFFNKDGKKDIILSHIQKTNDLKKKWDSKLNNAIIKQKQLYFKFVKDKYNDMINDNNNNNNNNKLKNNNKNINNTSTPLFSSILLVKKK